jgi:hypothetical protein
MDKRKLWLCVGPIFLCLLDSGVTLLFQEPEFWAGDYAQARETNPPMRWLLQRHPLAFEAAVLGWIIAFSVAIFWLPERPARVISFALILGHTWGASTWIANFVPHGFWVTGALFLLSAIFIELTWVWYGPMEK